ncbi:hypothetical protein GCM10007964_02400 [Sphaerisporangium melleum]|uniref:Uncharacterized protein n=1 Tax=Sphaerisporangium melleum TaxID=321316 RepID=A0A917VCJ5_9ACTN|nr:hypothetical protein GCM10007964_02400 [Sphaerisporangium melleum]
MEGAQALEIAPAGVAELDVLPHDVGDRRALPHERDVLVTDPACHAASLRLATDTALPRPPGQDRRPRVAPPR